ncbi:MAG: chemotaxis protein CheW [Clostridiales bacterium]|nr:chemotaxis protein CheW [Clostridiales bacterium]MCF8021770.1 chemotaxis protein CheW [Clostridiales bacterium]
MVSAGEEQVVVFTLEEQHYAIPIASVLEIIRPENINSIPGTPVFLEGIIEIRGEIMPVMDLRKRFELSSTPYNNSTRIIMVDTGENPVGMVVDAVVEVMKIPPDSKRPAPHVISSNIKNNYINSIALVEGKMIILLEVLNILYDSEQQELQEFMEER